ncbi:DUF3224 domain-containing protein [Trinickia fusca]|uniref:DUF3224 domain-containing protein n=1 Tax=Trinickia fusca TaxID=2419777 RepID=A0A494X6A8_9BURK|nr:DUF3224 domain-containing protein [Trinickia fusca]RKP45940.1 DUF3224 domain-containing protein [Trinickia fusca]
MTQLQAAGLFDVKIDVQPISDVAQQTGIGRMSLDKKFHGDLDAVSRGEMLAFRSSEEGSAGYVAMEVITGKLHGRRGSFALQHSSWMTRGVPEQSIRVVPGSGTEELKGLAGGLTITIADGKHFYQFDYTLPAHD